MYMGVCENCFTKPAVHRHHIFVQSKLNRRLYGSLIDDDRNIQELCVECHLNKPVKHMSEKEFCDMMDIEVRSKSGKL